MQRHLLVSTKAKYEYKLQPLITSPGGKGIRAGLGLTKVMALSIQQVSSPSAIKRFLWIPKHIIWPLQCLVTSCRHAHFIKAVQFYSKSSVCHNSHRYLLPGKRLQKALSPWICTCCCMFCFILHFFPQNMKSSIIDNYLFMYNGVIFRGFLWIILVQ